MQREGGDLHSGMSISLGSAVLPTNSIAPPRPRTVRIIGDDNGKLAQVKSAKNDILLKANGLLSYCDKDGVTEAAKANTTKAIDYVKGRLSEFESLTGDLNGQYSLFLFLFNYLAKYSMVSQTASQ